VIFWGTVLINMFFQKPEEAFTGLGFIGVGGIVYFLLFRRA
jgi:hypothetical protein